MDLNDDGRLDILSGCYSAKDRDMRAPVWVLYGTEDGDFAEAQALKTEAGEDLVVRDSDRASITDRICTQPHAFDWDDDGDLDLIIGNFSGAFLLVINRGTSKAPRFEGKPEVLQSADGEALKVAGNHGAPFLVDWDGDGDIDIVSGSGAGGVQIAENTPGEDGKPRFAGFRDLIAAPDARAAAGVCPKDTAVLPSGSSRVWVGDANGDGKLDILLGDCLRRTHPAEGLTVEEAKAKEAAWSDAFNALRTEMDELNQKFQSVGDDAKADLQEQLQAKSKEMQTLYKSRDDFLESVSTGHVWLYLRK